MKRLIYFVPLAAFLLLGFMFPVNLQAQEAYTVQSFTSEVEINKDTSLDVSEEIKVNFASQRHGIFRTIPILHSSEGLAIKTPIEVLSVKDEEGRSYQYRVKNTGGNIEIRIGNPDTYVSGPKTYIIEYKAKNILRDYGEGPELYWNVVGSGWDTEVLNVSATVASSHAGIRKIECFGGLVGTSQKNCTYDLYDQTATFTSAQRLGTGRDLTLVLGLSEENNLTTPPFILRAWWFLGANWGYLFAALPFAMIFYFWKRRGRDKRYVSENIYYKPDNVKSKTVSLFQRKHIPLVYHPLDGISPSEVGTIIDERVQTHDLIAEIVELARLGFIKISETKDDHYFIRLKSLEGDEFDDLKDYQAFLLEEIFEKDFIEKSKKKAKDLKGKIDTDKDFVILSVLDKEFYKSLSEFKKKLYKRMKEEGFFAGNPERTRIKWLLLYGLIFAASTKFVIDYIQASGNFFPLILLVLLALVGAVLAYSMPRRTPKGYSLYRQIEGLKWYLNKGKWRYEEMEKRHFYEEILPLAISLKVVDKLSKQMSKLGVKPPSYFAVTSRSFNSSFRSFYDSSSKSLTSSPKSSSSSWSGGSGFSGGSSGGGFGGGGGGSW